MAQVRNSSRARRIARQHFRHQARLSKRLADQLRRYYQLLAGRARERFLRQERGLRLDGESLRTKTLEPDLIITDQDARILNQLLVRAEAQMWEESQDLVVEILPAVEPVPMPAVQVERIGARVTRITETTRRQVGKVISEGFDLGLSDQDIAENLRSVVEETYKGRADTIARTEIAMVDAEATVDAYGQVGVTHVIITDGPGCGWAKHNDEDKADGTVRTLEAWRAKPIAHPNCVRGAAPLEPGGGD